MNKEIYESIDRDETGSETLDRFKSELCDEIDNAREKHPLLSHDMFPDAPLSRLKTSRQYLNARQGTKDANCVDLINKQVTQAHLSFEMLDYAECKRQLVQTMSIISRMIAVIEKEADQEGFLPW